MSPKRSVARALLDQLHQFGVDHIFGVIGDAIIGLMDELQKHEKITFVLTRHESAAGFMASTYAKLTGKIGVCVATSGPGMANLLNGLGDAYADQVPVLALTGQVPSKKIGTYSKQYIDQQRFVEPIAAYTAQLSSPDGLIPLLNRALQTALKQKAVTHLSIPKDLFLQPFNGDLVPANPFLSSMPPSDLRNIPLAVQFLSQCRKPMILAGHGAKGCATEIQSLAQRMGAGILLSLGAKGLIPDHYEWMLGGIGEGGSQEATDIMQQCDGLLIVGAMWYPTTFLSSNIPFVQVELESDHIQMDKNLQTALIGDSKEILRVLLERITISPNLDWTRQLQQAKAQWRLSIEQESNVLTQPIHPGLVMRTLSEVVEPNAVIALDTGDHTVWFNRSFSTNGQDIVFSGTWRTLGYGLPAGVCAQLLFTDRQVIVIAGDGGFAMNMAELATVVMNNLPVKIIVLNNQCLAMEKNKMIEEGLTPYGTELVNPNFADLAASFGIAGIRISQADQLKDSLREFLQKDSPALIEIISSTEPAPLSKVKALSTVGG
jgi:pyruvate oxidase